MENETKPVGFLEEQPGEQSMMRLMSVVLVGVGILLCVSASIMAFTGNKNTGIAVQMGTTLLSFGIGGKLVQKFGEK
jgi:hypothetical protein